MEKATCQSLRLLIFSLRLYARITSQKSLEITFYVSFLYLLGARGLAKELARLPCTVAQVVHCSNPGSTMHRHRWKRCLHGGVHCTVCTATTSSFPMGTWLLSPAPRDTTVATSVLLLPRLDSFFKENFYLTVVDPQCHASFRYTAK